MLWFAVFYFRQFRQWFAVLVGGGASSARFVHPLGVLEMGSVTVSSEILGGWKQSSSLIVHSFLRIGRIRKGPCTAQDPLLWILEP